MIMNNKNKKLLNWVIKRIIISVRLLYKIKVKHLLHPAKINKMLFKHLLIKIIKRNIILIK
jgi:hypothetical protein